MPGVLDAGPEAGRRRAARRQGSRAVRVVVVESPAKARTLARCLGRGYKVLACYGHVSDLPAKAGSVNPDEGFAMRCESAGRRAARALGAIRSALEDADALVLATDPDREGEAIAWQVLEWLREHDALGERAVRRIALHEVTPAAVRTAMGRPRAIDMDLVEAWQARRALDYLVGYGLSPILWRKLPGCRSAGRVQSVALRLVCEREAEIEAFVAREYWTVEAVVAARDGAPFPAALVELDRTAVGEAGLATGAMAEDAAQRIRGARLVVAAVERDVLRRAPAPPFTTSTLQQEASRRLGFGIAETMAIAQRLYEGVDLGDETAGLITYMRTDSTAMARTAVAQARAVIRERFGDAYVPARPRTFRPRARHVHEAHEAIRPTDFARAPEALAGCLDRGAVELYGLIRKRALASQTAAARFDRVQVELASESGDLRLAAAGSLLAFDGHLRTWGERGEGAGNASGLPELESAKRVSVRAVRTVRRVTAAPPRYTEAGLVRRLEALGIGRPSTWAVILAVLQARGYAVVHERRFVPSERGRVATAFLEGFFGRWVDYGFTASMEADLDRIAGGALARQGMLQGFWGGFRDALEAAQRLERKAVRAALEDRLAGFAFGTGRVDRRCPACGREALELKLSRHGPFVGCGEYPACGYRRRLGAAGGDRDEGYAGPRALGSDPVTGVAVTLRRGPHGWYVQRGEGEESAKPQRVSLPPSAAADAVDLDLAVRLLALPREVGVHPESGQAILAGIGRYGPWLRHRETYAAIPADEDVLAIGLNRAVVLIAEKAVRESRARGPKRVLRRLGAHPQDGAPVWLKTGRYGPFVAHRRTYASLPDEIAADALTLAQAIDLLEREKGSGGGRRGGGTGRKGSERARGGPGRVTPDPVERDLRATELDKGNDRGESFASVARSNSVRSRNVSVNEFDGQTIEAAAATGFTCGSSLPTGLGSPGAEGGAGEALRGAEVSAGADEISLDTGPPTADGDDGRIKSREPRAESREPRVLVMAAGALRAPAEPHRTSWRLAA